MSGSLQSKITNFITFKLANRALMAIGYLLTPFSRVSSRPVLPNAQFPWAHLLEDNWELIQLELKELLASQRTLPNIQEIQPAEASLTNDNRWKTFFLLGFGHKADKNRAVFPTTSAVLDQVPDILTAFFSILHPGKHIPAHKGIFKGIVRTHLGLIIPGQTGDCKMRVGKEYVYWEEGKTVFFDDTFNHEVWNNSDGIRVVLLLDTKRPYTKFGQRINDYIINSITRSVYVKDALKKNEDWEKMYYQVLA